MTNRVERAPWLLVQEGSKLSLLARGEQAFYLIAVNKKLTAEAEEQLARCGSMTNMRLEELGLTFREFPKAQLRGVALTGSEAGETIYFYPNSGKKQKFVLSDDYDQAQIDTFFAGLEHFTPPGQKRKKNKDPESWRIERQNPALYEKMGWIPSIMLALGIASSVGYLMNRTWPWFLAYLVCLLIPVALDIVFPAYFTLITEKGGPKDAHDLSIPMWLQFLVLALMPDPNWLDETLFLKLWAICGVLAALALGLLAEEFRRKKGALLAALFVAGVAGAFVIGHINSVFDFSTPEVYTLAVEELDQSRSGKRRSYECTVTLPDGRQAEINISREFYNTLDAGDEVQVELHDGALGIEYVNAYPVE